MHDLEPVKKKRGALLVHERMRDEIMWMEIAPGSALDEVALAAKYQVSRTPVREALLLLANEGFVHFLQNRTTIVAPLSLDNTSALLDTFLLLSRGLVRAAAMAGAASRETLAGFVENYRCALESSDIKTAFRAQLALYRHLSDLARNAFLGKYVLAAQDACVRLKLLYFFPNLDAAEKGMAADYLHAVINAVIRCDTEAGDAAVVRSILFEMSVVQRSLGPRFGHVMKIGVPADG